MIANPLPIDYQKKFAYWNGNCHGLAPICTTLYPIEKFIALNENIFYRRKPLLERVSTNREKKKRKKVKKFLTYKTALVLWCRKLRGRAKKKQAPWQEEEMKAVYFDTKTATVNEEFESVGQARAILGKKSFVDVMDYGKKIRVFYHDNLVWDENIDNKNFEAYIQSYFHATVINEDRKVEYMRVPVLYNAPVTSRKWNYYQKADGTVVGRSYNQAFSNGIWYHPDGFENPGYRLINPESHLGY